VKVIYDALVDNRDLLGRIMSMTYVFVDGYIYYNNDVIKIRYDFIRDAEILRDVIEEDIFDYYQDIILLGENETIQNNLPQTQEFFKRLMYVVKNKDDFGTKRAVVFPYFHQRSLKLYQ
jgi:hypothetical protein